METVQKHKRYRTIKVANLSAEGITQPNLGMTIAEVVRKVQQGQTVPQSMPLYFGDKLQQLVGFENLTKVEQISFAREFKKQVTEAYIEAEKEAKKLNIEAQQKSAAEVAQ